MGPFRILCVGELLWDELPDGRVPGGAPFNVAAHLAALGAEATLLSRVGRDALADPLVAAVQAAGVKTHLLQHDDTLPTGTVGVTTGRDGQATYEIRAPAAWDRLEASPREKQEEASADALVFGTLAQRDAVSRGAIRTLWSGDALRVYDVNLRPPWTPYEVVAESLGHADLVKLNREELQGIAAGLGLPEGTRPAAEAIAERFGCRGVCVTAGGEGAGLLRHGRWTEQPAFPVEVIDTVGAGDAFLARLLWGWLRGEGDEELLREANRLGAYVAGCRGAIPPHEAAAITRPESGGKRPLR